MDIQHEIGVLRNMRFAVADRNAEIAQHELDARTLKATLIAEKQAAGALKVASETEAKLDPRYLDHERTRIAMEKVRDIELGKAECQRLYVLAEIARHSMAGVEV